MPALVQLRNDHKRDLKGRDSPKTNIDLREI